MERWIVPSLRSQAVKSRAHARQLPGRALLQRGLEGLVLTPSIGHAGAVLPKRPRILIVEDHAPTRTAMKRLITQAGAEVVTARDGEEGLGFLLTQRFDVLLTDLRMPVMDGFELVHHCMKLPESHRPARVIAISGAYDA